MRWALGHNKKGEARGWAGECVEDERAADGSAEGQAQGEDERAREHAQARHPEGAEGRACMSLPLGFGNKAGHLVFTWVAAAPTTPSLARGTASLPRVTCSQPRSVRSLVGRRLTIARDRLCLPTASRADCAESALNAPSPARGRADTHAVACAQHGFVAVRGVLSAAELDAPRRRRARIVRQRRRTCAWSADERSTRRSTRRTRRTRPRASTRDERASSGVCGRVRQSASGATSALEVNPRTVLKCCQRRVPST